MKVQIILLVCLMLALSSVKGQGRKWTGQKCGMDNQKLYDRTLNLDTCNDYCLSISWHYGICEINKGYGECYCGFY